MHMVYQIMLVLTRLTFEYVDEVIHVYKLDKEANMTKARNMEPGIPIN